MLGRNSVAVSALGLCMVLIFPLPSLSGGLMLPGGLLPNHTTVSRLALPSIPGFSTRIDYDRTKPLDQWEWYITLIAAMNINRIYPWDFLFGLNRIRIGAPDLSINLIAQCSPSSGPRQFRAKHLIMGLYEIGCKMVSQQPGNYYDTSAIFSVEGQNVGSIRTGKRRQTIPAGALAPDKVNLGDIIRPAQRGDTFSVTDPQYPQFRVFGTFTGENIEIEGLFTASLNILAQAAVHPSVEIGASVKAISADDAHYASVFIEVVDAGIREGTPNLLYGQISQAILCLWRMFKVEKKFGGLELVVEYRDEEVGSGRIAMGRRSSEDSVVR